MNEKEHKKFLEFVLETLPKKPSIQLFDFQKDVINQMILTDSGYFEIDMFSVKVDFHFKTSILGLSIGNGKTVITLGRIEKFLSGNDSELNFSNSDFKKRKLSKGERVLIAVPSILYVQWLHEMISFWGLDFVVNNVYFTDKNFSKNFDKQTFECLKRKKILIVKHNGLQNLYKNPQFINLNFHFLFLDESHLVSNKEILESHVKFVWKISASELHSPHYFNFNILGAIRKTNNDSIIKKNIDLKSTIKGVFFNLPALCEKDVFFQPSKIIRVFNLDNLKNTILFDPNSTSVILEKIDSDCKIKKEQIVINEIGDFLEKKKSIPKFDDLLKRFKKETTQQQLSYFPLDVSKYDTSRENLVSTMIFIKENIIVNELKENVTEIEQLMHNIIKKLTLEDKTCAEYKKRILEDYCPVCLEETSTNILSVCCRQKICCQCLQTIIQSGKSTCPFCRQYYVRDLMELENLDQFPKNYLATYLDTIKEICGLFDKVLVVFSANQGGLKHIFTDSLNVPYLILNSQSTLKSSKFISNFRKAKGKMILFISSNFFNTGLNLEFVDCMFFLNDFLEIDKNQMVGRANRYPRTNHLNVVYLKEKVY